MDSEQWNSNCLCYPLFQQTMEDSGKKLARPKALYLAGILVYKS